MTNQEEPLYVTEAEGTGLLGRFKFSRVSVFKDKIVVTFANGEPDSEISYDEIVDCEVEDYNKWSQWGQDSASWTLPKVKLTIKRRTSGKKEKIVLVNVPESEAINNCDLGTWVQARINSTKRR